MQLLESQKIFAHNVAVFIQEIVNKGYTVTFGETYRTKEQAFIYAHEGKGIINSLHCSRLAVDLNIFAPDGKELLSQQEFEPFGKIWEALHPHNRAGVNFMVNGKPKPDSDHFQMNPL